MAIVRKYKDLFDKEQSDQVLIVHRWAVLFGIVASLVFFLAVLARGRDFFSIWPTGLTQMFEYVFYFGWAGTYIVGLIAYLIPQIVDLSVEPKESARLSVAFLFSGLGLSLLILQALARYLGWPVFSHATVALAGSVLQCTGLLLVDWVLFSWMGRGRNTVWLLSLFRLVGMALFTAAAIFYLILISLQIGHATAVIDVHSMLLFRLLALSGLGLTTFGFLVRMIPELLGWRPLDQKQMRNVFLCILASTIFTIASHGYYHTFTSHWFAFVYALSTVFLLSSLVWFLMTLDLFHVRLAPIVNKEHVLYVYNGLAWLLISVGIYLVSAVFELKRGQTILQAWDESTLIAFFIGFISMTILGIYTYWINQQPNAYGHKDRLSVIALVLFDWLLVLRVFVYPFMVSYAWEGYYMFGRILDIGFVIAFVLISVDMYDGLLGHRWFAARRADKA